jgi:hypothetical protein
MVFKYAGGLYYKCMLGAMLSGARQLSAGHLDILKITCIRRLKEDFRGKTFFRLTGLRE